MNKQIAAIISISILIFMTGLYSQERELREYQPEEYISLDKNLRMNDALSIIDQFTQKYDDKLILDSKEHNMPIGVVVDHMHWKRALEYILRSNNLKYEEHPRHYEIVPESKDSAGGEGFFDHISLQTREIEIKAIFFEADYAAMSEIGVDWSTITDGKVKLRMSNAGASQVSQGLFTVQASSEKFLNVIALIKAIESRDKGQVIANPQIRIMDGEQGKIKVGKNFFLTTRDFAGNTRYSEYESGTILTVIPTILIKDEKQFIHLDIMAENSDVEVTSLGVTKKITEGKTQVLLLDGEETALAGLFSNQRSLVRKGVPILKDLPWWFFGIRYLMGYNSQKSSKKELIILIEPHIVPSLEKRMVTKKVRKNYIERRRREFNKKYKDLSQ